MRTLAALAFFFLQAAADKPVPQIEIKAPVEVVAELEKIDLRFIALQRELEAVQAKIETERLRYILAVEKCKTALKVTDEYLWDAERRAFLLQDKATNKSTTK